jgi:hypothetical protein
MFDNHPVVKSLLIVVAILLATTVSVAFADKPKNLRRIGYVDKRGKLVIEPRFSSAGQFHNGLAPASFPNQSTYCFINKSGAVAISPCYNGEHCCWAQEFHDGLAPVAFRNSYGYIDSLGQFVITPRSYLYASHFSEGYAVVSKIVKGHKKYGFIDKKGREVIPLQFSFAAPFKNGFAKVIVGGTKSVLVGVVNGDCSEIPGTMGKQLYVNLKGEVVDSVPDSFDYAASSGLKSYFDKATGMYGFKNKEGEVVICPRFSAAYEFSEGLAGVRIGKPYGHNYGFIDAKGSVVIPMKYENGGMFYEGLASVGDSGTYGFIDKSGKVVVPLSYRAVSQFSEGLAAVELP